MEYLLGRGSTVRLSDVDPVSLGGLHDSSHNLGHGNEDPSHLFGRHLNHTWIVFLRNHQGVSRIQRVYVEEGDRILILEDDYGSCFFRDDLAEDAVLIHGSIPLP